MTVTVSSSRSVRLGVEAAYDGTIDVRLQELFTRRYLALLPVISVYGQEGLWGRELGQTRVVRSADGGALLERVTALDRPHRFGYRLEGVQGRMSPFIKHVDAAWSFTPNDVGTTITWSWELTPTSALTVPMVALVGRMWHGYARRTLANLALILAP